MLAAGTRRTFLLHSQQSCSTFSGVTCSVWWGLILLLDQSQPLQERVQESKYPRDGTKGTEAFQKCKKFLVPDEDPLCSPPAVPSFTASNNTRNTDHSASFTLHYEILQFPLEDEYFGGLWGGRKDFERFRLLALLPALFTPEVAPLVTE